MLVEAGGLVSTASGWIVADPQMLERVPTTVRAMIAARLDGLPPDEKRVLQCASVSGELTWDRLLERLAPGIDVPRVLRSMVSRDLLRRRRGSQAKGSNEFIFKHALIRDVAYGSLPRGERARLHVDVAGWLLGDANMPREPVDDLAIHYAEAWRLSRSMTAARAPEGLARSAALYLGRWAEETMARQALLAESLYARALEVGDEAPGEVDPELRARHAIGRAECLIELGRHQEATGGRDVRAPAGGRPQRRTAGCPGARRLGTGRIRHGGRRPCERSAGSGPRVLRVGRRRVGSGVGDPPAVRDRDQDRLHLGARAPPQGARTLRRGGGSLGASDRRAGSRVHAQHDRRNGVPGSVSRGEATRRGRRRSSFSRRAAPHARVLPLLLRRARRRHRDHAGGAPDRDRRGRSLRRGGLAADRGARRGRDAFAEGGRTGISSGRRVRPADPLGPRAVAGKGRGCASHAAFGRPARRRAASGVISSSPRAVGSADGDARGRPVGCGDVPRSGSLGSGSRAGGGGGGGRARERRATDRTGRCVADRPRGARRGRPVRRDARLWAEAVAMARVAGATGTLSVARAAFDQALLLSGRRPRSRRPLGSGIVLEAIEAENHGLASMVADGNEEAVASFRDAVELWRGPRMDGLARSRARHARGGAPSLGRPATGRAGAHPGAEGARPARDAGRESRCDPRAARFRLGIVPLAELGADGARVAVLVGHDVDRFEADVSKQSFHRRGLVASQLQQEPTAGLQPTCAPPSHLRPAGPCRRRRRRGRAEVRTPARRAGASGASPSARTERRPSARRRGASKRVRQRIVQEALEYLDAVPSGASRRVLVELGREDLRRVGTAAVIMAAIAPTPVQRSTATPAGGRSVAARRANGSVWLRGT